MNKQPLFLTEQIMLLALHDEKGTITSENYAYALGGAVLAELLLGERLRVVEEGKKNFVEVINRQAVGDEVIDECLNKVIEAKKRDTVENWVSKFASVTNLRDRVALKLCRRGILRADESQVLWIFTRKIYPEIDPKPERELIRRLEKAIFTDDSDVSAETVVLTALANGANLLHHAFDRKQLKERKQRIEQLISGDVAGKAARSAIESMQAALMVAVMMPIMITTVIN